MDLNPKTVFSSKYALILILFIMPFINVSCSGMADIPLSGLDLAIGETLELKDPFSGKIQEHKLPAEPLASVALLCAIVGLISGLLYSNRTKLVPPIAGGVGAVILLLLQSQIAEDALKEGEGLLTAHYSFAYWAVLMLFLTVSYTHLTLPTTPYV